MLKISSKQLVTRMSILQSVGRQYWCESCLEGKIRWLPFRDVEYKMTARLEIVHADLCGPMKDKSIGGSSYSLMLLIEDDTKFRVVYFLKKESEGAECVKNYKAHEEKVHSQKGSSYVIKAGSNRRCRGVYQWCSLERTWAKWNWGTHHCAI